MKTKITIKDKKVCFLGAGNMAEALISGLIDTKIIPRKNIIATDIKQERIDYIKKKFSIEVSPNNIKSILKSDIIFIAVKPQQIDTLLSEIENKINSKQLVISIVTGITVEYINKYLPAVPVIRIMPNTPALIREGIFVVCSGKYVKKSHEKIVKEMLNKIGIVIFEQENKFDTVTAISGSGPAYVFYIAESMIKIATEFGLDPEISRTIVNQIIFGAGKMLKMSSDTADILRQKVTSPGGTTEQAIKCFEEKGLFSILHEAIERAKNRATELTK